MESGLIDVLMFSVNPCYDLQPGDDDIEQLWAADKYAGTLTNMDPDREKLYETCQRLGVGITVMKAFGGGDLLSAALSPAGRALTPLQCLHYALTRPAVASVMCGARSVEELRASIAYEDAPEAERDYAAAFAAMEGARSAEPERAKKYAQVLLNQAKLIAGLPIGDPSAYTDLLCSLWS